MEINADNWPEEFLKNPVGNNAYKKYKPHRLSMASASVEPVQD
jgi:hypothetical protein